MCVMALATTPEFYGRELGPSITAMVSDPRSVPESRRNFGWSPRNCDMPQIGVAAVAASRVAPLWAWGFVSNFDIEGIP